MSAPAAWLAGAQPFFRLAARVLEFVFARNKANVPPTFQASAPGPGDPSHPKFDAETLASFGVCSPPPRSHFSAALIPAQTTRPEFSGIQKVAMWAAPSDFRFCWGKENEETAKQPIAATSFGSALGTSCIALCSVIALIFLIAPSASADSPRLSLPVACSLGETCFIQHLVDHDPGPGLRDFTCGSLTYEGHKGTDFRLSTLSEMADGVPVRAAAPGRVRAARDGMADRMFIPGQAQSVDGRECGNGVVVEHGAGWETQYCHLRNGSVAVQPGDNVPRGAMLGQIGLSGRTQFPHLHLSVRHNGKIVDPFAPDATTGCVTPGGDDLWETALPYRPGALLSVGFAAEIPTFDNIRAGDVKPPTGQSGALVLYGFAFGGHQGDTLHMVIYAPDGSVFVDQKATLDRAQAQFFRAAGKRLRAPYWPKGQYKGEVMLIRAGKVLDRRAAGLSIE